jgi:hypothetical protein
LTALSKRETISLVAIKPLTTWQSQKETKMTATAELTRDEKEAAKAAREARAEEIEKKETELNKGRSGKGTRIAIGLTRGRNPQMVQYEAFDESQPDTVPSTISEFMDIAKVTDEKTIMGYLIDGYNSAMQSAASDPTSEFVEASWPLPVQTQFKLVVKNYAAATKMSIEDVVAMIKPGFEAAQAKVLAVK